jgi:ABC-type uncharacterized transport system substrate-binding protein
MDLRWGGGDIDRIRALAQELVGLQPDIILTGTATAAVQRETRTIPIVFAGVGDPVATSIVPRLEAQVPAQRGDALAQTLAYLHVAAVAP